MLVCNVSLRPARSAIAADVIEAITAVDAAATGNIVFATLVDDPASVGDLVDAYLGAIMLEAASADAVASAGSDYVTAIDETSTAADLVATGPAAAAAMTTTSSSGLALLPFDPLQSSSLTVIDAGR